MYQSIPTVLLWSGDFRKLANWYQEKFGFPVVKELDHPQDTGVQFAVGSSFLWVGQHSEVHGKNKDPFRVMFNIRVDSVQKVFDELSAKGVTFIAKPFKAPTFDLWFATFQDLDGNIGQIIGPRE
jgi:uncharacterized glyoxalase superfamily protein PhnB